MHACMLSARTLGGRGGGVKQTIRRKRGSYNNNFNLDISIQEEAQEKEKNKKELPQGAHERAESPPGGSERLAEADGRARGSAGRLCSSFLVSIAG